MKTVSLKIDDAIFGETEKILSRIKKTKNRYINDALDYYNRHQLTTKIEKEADILRVHLKKGMANLLENCDILIDQIRAIDNKRLIKKIGDIPTDLKDIIKENLRITLDLE
jgi:hypothetical protein